VFFNLIARSNFRRQIAKRLQAHFRVTPDEPMEETIHLNERQKSDENHFFAHGGRQWSKHKSMWSVTEIEIIGINYALESQSQCPAPQAHELRLCALQILYY